MEKYTFILEYLGGTYISQVLSTDIRTAVLLWADQLIDTSYLSATEKKSIMEEVRNGGEEPILIQGVSNVWSLYFLLNNNGCLVNIVLTK